MQRKNEKGVALIFALVMILVLSMLAISVMFVAQSETWSTMNYRMMTNARYAGEAGLQSAANWLMTTYVPPTSLTGYDTTVSPVLYNSTPVMFKAGNYPPISSYGAPSATDQASFSSAAQGSFTSGGQTMNFDSYATLLAMRIVSVNGSPKAAQTWQIVSNGRINGIKSAQVQVVGLLDSPVVPFTNYAAFATGKVCASLNMSGNGTSNSYNMSNGSPPAPVISPTNGNVGTNGGFAEGGSAIVDGTLSTPRAGTGTCSSGTVTAWSPIGGATVTGGVIQLPAPLSFPAPVIPPPGTINPLTSTGCAALLTACAKTGPSNRTVYTLNPSNSGGSIALGDIAMGSQDTLTLGPGTYNINSLSMTAQSTLNISPNVIINITGNTNTVNSLPLNMNGGSFSNPTFNAAGLHINYAGTQELDINGGAQNAAVLYAPNAFIKMNGTADWYGSILGSTILMLGTGGLHYDNRLATNGNTVLAPMLTSFNWSKY